MSSEINNIPFKIGEVWQVINFEPFTILEIDDFTESDPFFSMLILFNGKIEKTKPVLRHVKEMLTNGQLIKIC